ncbi:hypothetical protein CARUB_v10016104mg [Capsella rubella]|uniref:Myb/SANT-like DNA-binding domain-containing protein n=1 Tax=Capsella rubella TaxID=81985 RepID=R0HSJ6_9BRAS|nr:uncharacterized protein LOC17891806 [Capsella rubella]EOA32794.1 hypothetical protein CARUB_v10016104mg [Capsella rubella]
MESNVMFSGFSPRMLSLEMPQNPQNPQNSVQFQHPHPYTSTSADQQTQPPMIKPLYPYASAPPSKPKQLSPMSGCNGDDEDRGSGSGSGCNPDDSAGTDGKRKLSQWHRMKWTDTMVRLLIMAVFYIGDEAGLNDPIDVKKKSGGGGGGMLQKKGKWKSVSRAMVEKGFSVSPQQCEDKFNDLNKRYKRVNDILGKGIACRVVENQGLLESMDHLTPKLKDEVKKLLNSKHLFFREMCAYHNSCGHLGGHDQPPQQSPVTIPVQQNCFHAAEAGKMARIAEREEAEEDVESDMAEDSESEMEESEEEEEEVEETTKKKRRVLTTAVKRLREEAARVVEDVGKSVWEKKEWMRRKMLEIEEKKIGYEWEGVEMEKQRVKWMRYRSKKEREMEKAKLDNQRRRLETERMVLMLRRSEIELNELQSSGKRVDPCSATG